MGENREGEVTSKDSKAVFHYQFDWGVITSGKYFGWLLSGFYTTVQLSTVSVSFRVRVGSCGGNDADESCLAGSLVCSRAFLEFFRNTPLLVQIFFWYFGSYKVLPQAVNDWLAKTNFEFAAAAIALTVYTSAFIAEDIRSGSARSQGTNGGRAQFRFHLLSERCSTSSCRKPSG